MEEGKKNKVSIAVIAVVLIVFIAIFQVYMAFEKRSYMHSEELLADSFSVVEVSMEDEDQTYYVNDQEIIFNQLVQGLETATFKPTKQTSNNPDYIIRMYNESLQVETTITVFPNQQMQVNDQMFNVEEANLTSFEDILLKNQYKIIFNDFDDFATYMHEKITESGMFAETNQEWAEVIALARIAQEMEVDLIEMGLLFFAPTKEVAEQLIAYGVTSYDNYGFLIQAVIQERIDVAKVLLESDTGADPSNRIIGEPSPIVIAKLNEDDEMVDLLLNYEFEDEYVNPKHIEQAQNIVDFKSKDLEEVMTDLERGVLPGVDFQIPTSSQEIMKIWGDYTEGEEHSILSYNRHSFWRAIDLYKDGKDRDYDDIYAYMYQPSSYEAGKIIDIKETLGEPDDMFINNGVSELIYDFGDYRLSFTADSEGDVWNISYYYEEDEEVFEE